MNPATTIRTDGGAEESPYEYPSMSEDGLDQCVSCGETFGTGLGNVLAGPVYNADTGVKYDTVGDSPAGSNLAHPGCFKELDTERKGDQNLSLEEFGTGGGA